MSNEEVRRKKKLAEAGRGYGPLPAHVTNVIMAGDDTCDVCGGHGRTVVEHDHVSGRVRGMACMKCNALCASIERRMAASGVPLPATGGSRIVAYLRRAKELEV